MASYGYEHSLSLGNINEGVLRANQQIHLDNVNKLTQYQNSIHKAVDGSLDKAKEQLTTIAGEQLATKGKAIKRSYEGAKQVAGALGEAKTMAFTKVPSSLLSQGATHYADVNAVVDFGRDASAVGTKVSDLGGHAGDMTNISVNFEKTGLGDIAGAGLQVGLGAIDLAGDIKAGKITGDNFLERAGNVMDMGAGVLETVGITADLTGVLAPEGIVANAVGGVIGLAGGVLDLAGDLEEELAPHNPATAPKTVAPLSTLATGTTGAEVKENILRSGIKMGT
jgi:hypothetical protein